MSAGGCERSGKIRFRNERTALNAAIGLSRKTAQARVYRCPWCDGYHLTKQPKRVA